MKSKSRVQYPPEVWTTIRALYESGNFNSLPELHDHCTKIMPKTPSIDSIKKKAAAEDWDKHDQDEQKTEEKKKNFVEHFAKLGIDDQKTAQLIAEGMHAGGDIGVKLLNAIMNSPSCGQIPDDDVTAAVAEYATSLKVRKYYIDMYLKLVGAYAPEKLKVVTKDGDLQKKTKFSDMTKEELMEMRQRLRERRGV